MTVASPDQVGADDLTTRLSLVRESLARDPDRPGAIRLLDTKTDEDHSWLVAHNPTGDTASVRLPRPVDESVAVGSHQALVYYDDIPVSRAATFVSTARLVEAPWPDQPAHRLLVDCESVLEACGTDAEFLTPAQNRDRTGLGEVYDRLRRLTSNKADLRAIEDERTFSDLQQAKELVDRQRDPNPTLELRNRDRNTIGDCLYSALDRVRGEDRSIALDLRSVIKLFRDWRGGLDG